MTIACWLAATVSGVAAMAWYAARPADAGNPPAFWRSATASGAVASRPSLTMFAHPHCPCTRASLERLARIMSRAKGRVDARIVFLVDPQRSDAWRDSALVRAARALPGVRVQFDPDGTEARSFAAPTSGLTLIYDQRGALRFSGGITAARGHAGDNAGADAVLDILMSERPPATRQDHPVFGCSLSGAGPRASGSATPGASR